MGGVIGLDQPALLQLAEALGYDRRAAALLLPYAEAGMVSALAEKRAGERTRD